MTCCNHDCNQGRECPNRPRPEPTEEEHWSGPTLWILAFFAAACAIATARGIPLQFPFS